MNDQKANPLVDPLVDLAAQQKGEAQTDEQVKEMNKPAVDPTGFNDGDQAFLTLVMGKIDSGEIDPLIPSTLINTPVYDTLDEAAQGKADLNAMSLIGKIRQIHDLYQVSQEPTFMIQNLVMDVKHTKEQLEELGGDLFII
jgi:hypothetical protein